MSSNSGTRLFIGSAFKVFVLAEALRQAIGNTIKDADWFDDVHGSAAYKRHLTYYYAEQIRDELS